MCRNLAALTNTRWLAAVDIVSTVLLLKNADREVARSVTRCGAWLQVK